MLTFEDLITPVSLDTFLSEHWEKSPLFLEGNDGLRHSALLTIADVDEYLARGDLRYPAIRIIKDGKQVPLSAYSSSFTLGAHSSNDLLQTDRVLQLYREGGTILIQMAHYAFPKLQAFAAALEKFWGFVIEMNVYLTPPNNQGFEAHYDTHSVFILQASGQKRWSIYEQTSPLPLVHERFNKDAHEVGVVQKEVTLRAGSFLYLPRGLVHSAAANDEPSLHVTVGLFPFTWLDVFTEHLSRMSADARFREAFHAFGLKNAATSEHHIVKGLLHEFAATFDPAELRRRLNWKNYTGQIQPAKRRLIDIVKLSELNIESKFQLKTGLNILVHHEEEATFLRCFNVTISFPIKVKQALIDVLARESLFRARDLAGHLDEAGKFTLCKRLVAEGILTVGR